jgi:hypothetical protein
LNILGVDRNCQGGELIKGRTMPMISGSNIDEGQQAVPTGTSKTMSAVL